MFSLCRKIMLMVNFYCSTKNKVGQKKDRLSMLSKLQTVDLFFTRMYLRQNRDTITLWASIEMPLLREYRVV